MAIKRKTTFRTDYGYQYPRGLDLKPGSEIHDKIVNMVLNRALASKSVMNERYNIWRGIDQKLTYYIPLDKEEKRVTDPLSGDPRKPVSIVVPMCSATLDILLTYMVASLLQPPILRFEPTGREDAAGVEMMQYIVALQVRRFKAALRLHTAWRDAFTYGFGASSVKWAEKKRRVRKTIRKLRYSSILGREVETNDVDEQVENEVVFEGNMLDSIDPYMFLPDPNVPIDRLQDGEYVGWVDRTNIMDLLRVEEDSDGDYFNVRYVKEIDRAVSRFYEWTVTGRYNKDGLMPGYNEGVTQDVTNAVDTIPMYIDIIPSDLGLGDSDYPEKWYFEVAADEVLIAAMPLNEDHGDFPVLIDAPNYDGHRVVPVSHLESIYGLQTHIDWMFRSHAMNIRKALHNMFIVDPELVNVPDVQNPGAGNIIRLRRSMWGRGVQDAIQQLNVTDITRANLTEIPGLMQLADQVSGTADMLKGSVRRTGERVSATEAQSVFSGALSRLEKCAMLSSLMYIYDMGLQFASNTRQYMTKDVWVTQGGLTFADIQSEYGLQAGTEIKPEDIDIFVDMVPSDGSVPNAGSATTWVQLFQVLSASPELSQTFDTVRIFKHIARTMGAKNVNSFVRSGGNVNFQTMEQGEIEQGLQEGNLATLEEAL